MQKSTGLRACALLMLASLTPTLYAQGDLDIESARRRYETQKDASDRAKVSYEQESARLQGLNTSLSQARQQEQQAKAQLSTAQSDLTSTEQSINYKERQISDFQSDIVTLRMQLQQRQSSQSNFEQQRGDHQRRIDSLGRQLDQIESELGPLRSDPVANRDRINSLESQKQNLERERQTETQSLRHVENQLRSIEYDIQNYQNSIASKERDINQYRTDIASLDRQRSRLLSDINFYRAEVSRNSDRVRDAERDVSTQQGIVNASYSNYQQKLAEANDAYNYYQQVVANYNRELDRVYQTADRAAADHAGREAIDRATGIGRSDGATQGASIGQSVGENDGKALQVIKGYRYGRSNPRADSALSAANDQGIATGKAYALKKATGEDYPRGYNDALSEVLASTPEKEETLDLRGEASATAGDSSPEASRTRLNSIKVPDLSYPVPSETTANPPPYQAPTVNVPTQDERYANAPCSGLVLPDFEPKCRIRYRDSYAATFKSQYRSVYLNAYRTAFEPAANGAYNQARAQSFPDAFNTGSHQGANEQGQLDGFASQINDVRAREYARGASELRSQIANAHLLIPRSFSLKDRNNDGIYSPGEPIDLNIAIDNLGGRATPDKKLKLLLNVKVGVDTVRFDTRELPAIGSRTRVTLIGSTTLTAQNIAAGSKLQISGELQALEANGSYRSMQSFSLSEEVHYPLELTAIDMDKVPAVGETVKTKFKLVNKTNLPSPEAKLALSVAPKLADISKGTDIVVPPLDAGGEMIVNADVKPGIWVGGNTGATFISDIVTAKDDRTQTTQQPFRKVLAINRSASALVFDANGAEIPSGVITVRAGQTVSFLAQLKFHATQAHQGPFVLRAIRNSHPEIRFADGSTTGINYGTVGPTTQIRPIRISYVIPESLKGKQAYVMLQLDEGNVALHAPIIYLDVK